MTNKKAKLATKTFAFHFATVNVPHLISPYSNYDLCAIYMSYKESDSTFAYTAFSVSIIHSNTVFIKCTENTIMNGIKFHYWKVHLWEPTHNFQHTTYHIYMCKKRSNICYTLHTIKSIKFKKIQVANIIHFSFQVSL